jgi:phage baseplate assembly protein gpV
MKFGNFVSNWLALITAKFHHVRSYDASNIREYILVSLFNEHGVVTYFSSSYKSSYNYFQFKVVKK